ncbi:MAG: polyhydroxyalkanoate synthesis repressor PhaR [Arhodomonas sp.]|nr:polyhydroxyalkanoate synthesis repressor PhaR [Arhodomonas sp.]
MSDIRVIKKYPNRRLYDTAISSYITLADVKRLVLDGVDFEVVDAKTKNDLTRSILLQIISEEEEGGEPHLSSDLLAQIIRSYGGNMQNMLTSYLEKSMEMWEEQQRLFHERTRTLMGASTPCDDAYPDRRAQPCHVAGDERRGGGQVPWWRP